MLSIPDMAVIGTVALLVFGPEQLPKVARKAGQVMRDLQNTSQSFIREMERAADASDVPKPVFAPDTVVVDAVTNTEPSGLDETLAEPALVRPAPLPELTAAPQYHETPISAAPAYHEAPLPPSS
ncbi:MAG: TatA/E family twin arginine-targeting protein translocase [Candidatus Velthaea sp.]